MSNIDHRNISVAVVIEDNKSRVCMGYHIARQGWEWPGGAVMPGETLVAAARREAFEETGIECEGAMKLMGVMDQDPEWLCTVFRTIATSWPLGLPVQEPDVHREWAWVRYLPESLSVNGDIVARLILRWPELRLYADHRRL